MYLKKTKTIKTGYKQYHIDIHILLGGCNRDYDKKFEVTETLMTLLLKKRIILDNFYYGCK